MRLRAGSCPATDHAHRLPTAWLPWRLLIFAGDTNATFRVTPLANLRIGSAVVLVSSFLQQERRSMPAPKQRGVLSGIDDDANHHIAGSFVPASPTASNFSRPPSPLHVPKSHGLWADIISMRWMRVPSSSLKMIVYLIVLYLNWELLQWFGIVSQDHVNPFGSLLFISHRVPSSTDDEPYYQKGPLDLVFIAFYVIVWSFVRQFLTLYLFPPVARRFGIRKQAKLERFGEQGYALLYFSFMSLYGFAVMSSSKIWWFRTEHFWIDYPHWRMTPLMKSYYLLHSAYWTQQFLVLVLGLEKPRKDYTELIIHHIVTLWLVGWSYLINLTQIGNAVFLTHDFSDIFLALVKLLNYMRYDRTKSIVYVGFVGVWTYFRHYLNLKMLYSVWTEFNLIPEFAKQWSPEDGVWLPYWMRYQIFAPLVLLQIVNVFWYFLIWRILVRAVLSSKLDDERSDDEEDEKEENKKNQAPQLRHPYPTHAPNGVSNRAGRSVTVVEDDDD